MDCSVLRSSATGGPIQTIDRPSSSSPGRCTMVSTRPLVIASSVLAVWLVLFTTVPAAQAQKHTPAPAAAPSRSSDERLGPIIRWHMEKKTDALSGESSTQPTGLKFVAGANGKLQGLVRATAY